MKEQMVKKTDLDRLSSLSAKHLELLKKHQGIRSVEMFLSLSNQPGFRDGLIGLLQITTEELKQLLDEAKALFSDDELTAMFSSTIQYPMGAILEDDGNQDD